MPNLFFPLWLPFFKPIPRFSSQDSMPLSAHPACTQRRKRRQHRKEPVWVTAGEALQSSLLLTSSTGLPPPHPSNPSHQSASVAAHQAVSPCEETTWRKAMLPSLAVQHLLIARALWPYPSHYPPSPTKCRRAYPETAVARATANLGHMCLSGGHPVPPWKI